MRPTVTLKKDSTSVALPAPARVVRTSFDSGQAHGRTAGGETFVYELGTDRHEAELEFHSLTDAERDGLASFFKDATDGMSATWQYTDPAGGEFQARFAEPALVFVKFARNVWDVSIRLEIEGLLD